MLFNHSHLEKKLREHGRAAPAEILSIKTEGSSGTQNPFKAWSSDDSDLTTTWFLCRLELRVMPPGEPAFEKTVHSRLNTLKSKGDSVPVLYDPNDHDSVVVDYQADAKAEMDRLDALQRHNREWEARYGASASTAGDDSGAGTDGALDPELQKLMDLEEAERGASAAPTSAATDTSAGSEARLDQLKQLGELHSTGVLTDAEFAEEKKRILGES
jgi:hypothetical protein